jgi:hypothetical protein
MRRRPPVGPRRQWPPPAGHEGDRNGEPSEVNWVGCFLWICLVSLVAIVGIALIAATFPIDRVYSSDRLVIVCAPV